MGMIFWENDQLNFNSQILWNFLEFRKNSATLLKIIFTKNTYIFCFLN